MVFAEPPSRHFHTAAEADWDPQDSSHATGAPGLSGSAIMSGNFSPDKLMASSPLLTNSMDAMRQPHRKALPYSLGTLRAYIGALGRLRLADDPELGALTRQRQIERETASRDQRADWLAEAVRRVVYQAPPLAEWQIAKIVHPREFAPKWMRSHGTPIHWVCHEEPAPRATKATSSGRP